TGTSWATRSGDESAMGRKKSRRGDFRRDFDQSRFHAWSSAPVAVAQAASEHGLPSLCAQRTFCPLPSSYSQRSATPLGTQAEGLCSAAFASPYGGYSSSLNEGPDWW